MREVTVTVVSLVAEELDMTTFSGRSSVALGRVRVTATDGEVRVEWWTNVVDAPRIGDRRSVLTDGL